MSLLWIWYTCNILVSLLKDIAELIQIPNSFMGMTILTFGNSIPDLLLNIRLAKKGYGEMAVSSAIAGPLFSLLVGLGSSLIKTNLKIGTINFNFFKKSNIINILALIFLFINLICLAIISKLQNYVLNIKLSYFVFSFYCVVLLIICLIVFL
jgi:sodium/potassium/calcium exchanger 6